LAKVLDDRRIETLRSLVNSVLKNNKEFDNEFLVNILREALKGEPFQIKIMLR